MRSIRQFSHKKNFEVKTNDVFNLDQVPLLTLNEVRRGKKHVDNVRLSNFNGISLNFEYNKQAENGTLNELTELNARHNKQHIIGKRVISVPVQTHENEANKYAKTLNDINVAKSISFHRPNFANIQLTKCDDILISNEAPKSYNQTQKDTINYSQEQPLIKKNIKNEFSLENPIMFAISRKSGEIKQDENNLMRQTSIKNISNNETIIQDKPQIKLDQNFYESSYQNPSQLNRPDLPPLKIPNFTPLTKNSRNIINNSMIKDYMNLASLTSKMTSSPAMSNYDNSTGIAPHHQNSQAEGKIRFHSAQPPLSTKNEGNVRNNYINN